MVRGTGSGGHILVVDDNKINLMMLERALTTQGYQVTSAVNGGEALEILYSPAGETIDVVLLDILMPDLDGYQILEKIKEKEQLRHIPVIMISALDEMDSVIRCIEMGATDYLHKPYNPSLLEARLNASLADKRLRDLEIEYLDQVGHVISAAESIENSTYAPESLEGVAAREDALGNLARVFQSMAEEIHLREQRLKQQLEQLRIDVEDMKKSMSEPLSVYLPMDRRQALVHGVTLPEFSSGSVLFVDISGFTPMTESLANELGRKRGAEELTRILNQVYGALIEVVHQFHGSVVGFSGDAITCYFDGDEGLLAAAGGLEMQKKMHEFSSIGTPSGRKFSLGVKIAAVAGPVRRYLVGDPEVQNIEVLAGKTLDVLAVGEHLANSGELLVHESILNQYEDAFDITYDRTDEATGERFFVVSKLTIGVPVRPWIELRKDVLSDEVCRPWLLPAVYEQSRSGAKGYLSEFRQAAALFLSFSGIDYDNDPEAGGKLDSYFRWVQSVVAQYEGSLLQLTMGDKGSYLYAVFGAPLSHNDDAVRAIYAASALQDIPPEFGWIREVKIGVTLGQMRSGSYGSSTRRTYGAQGDKVNLAARLMQASEKGVVCDRSIYLATQSRLGYEELEAVSVKGVEKPVEIYRPTGEKIRLARKRVRLIGRTREQIEIGRSLQSIKSGPGKIFIIEGEAGIGKTRLIEKLTNFAEELGFKTYCPSTETGTDNAEYQTWRDIIWQLYRLDDLPGEKERYEKLLSVLNGSGNGSPPGSELKIIHSIINSQPAIHELEDEAEAAKQINDVFTRLLLAGTGSSPAIFILDNAQDLDHGSWEVIQRAGLTINNMMIVAATRPLSEPRPAAYMQNLAAPGSSVLSLKSLSADEGYLLACEHLGVVGLPQEMVELIDQAGGNPQFIEEMIYILRDDGYIQVENGECKVLPHVNLDEIVFPTTAEGLIKSRIDRLSPSEQLTLKIASVIGEEFSLDLLSDLYPLDSDRPFIVKHLETFSNLDLISTGRENQRFIFRDAITFEAVYSSMLFSQRRQLHRQVAEWIEVNNGDELPSHYALLADHWRKADDTAKAIDYLEKAGQRALELGEYEQAEQYFRECLELDATAAVLSTEFFKKKLRGEYIQS